MHVHGVALGRKPGTSTRLVFGQEGLFLEGMDIENMRKGRRSGSRRKMCVVGCDRMLFATNFSICLSKLDSKVNTWSLAQGQNAN